MNLFQCTCSVNYRPEQFYTKYWVDLAAADRWDQPYPWITELEVRISLFYLDAPNVDPFCSL